MKHYKLLRDLPTFRAGEEFYLNDRGDLVSAEEGVVVYSTETLDKFPNILIDWFESANMGFYLDEGGYIVGYDCNEDSHYLNYRKSIGNDFKTEEEAKKHKEYLIALQTIKNDTKGFEPNWEDYYQLKYYGCYSYTNNRLNCFSDGGIQIQGTIYFKSEEDLKESFEKHRKEWLTVLGVEEAKNETN